MKLIALFEALKAVMVLLAGILALELLHRDIQAAAEQILHHLHIDPVARLPRQILRLAGKVNDRMLWMVASGAVAYASLRLAEAYGLWRNLGWAKWLGAVSGAIYLPYECYELSREITVVRIGTILANIAIVVYLTRSIVLDRRRDRLS